MGGFGGNCKSDSLRYALETVKTQGEGHLSEYHKQLVHWTKNVDKRYAWVVLVALWIMMAASLGPYRIYGLIFAKVTEDEIYTREEATWPVSMIFTVENIMGPFISVITYYISFQQSLLIGAFLLTIGNGASWLSDSLWMDVLFLGFIQGLGYAFIFMPFMEIINNYFLKYRNIALGFALCGGTISIFAWSPLARWILETYEWRVAYLATAVICSLNFLMIPLLKPNPRPTLKVRSRLASDMGSGKSGGPRKPDGATRNGDQSGGRGLSRLSLRALSYQSSIRRQTTMIITRKTSVTRSGLRREESVVSLNPFASSAGLERQISRTIADYNPKGVQDSKEAAIKEAANEAPTEHYETVDLTEVGQDSDFDMSVIWSILKTPAFHLICYNELVYYWVFSIYCLVLADLGAERGCSKHEADLLLNYQSIGEMIGRLGLTILVDLRFLSNKNVVILVLIILGCLLVAVTQVSGFIWMAIITASVSATAALLYILLNGLLVDYLGERRVTMGYGLSSCIAGFLMFFRPQAVGYFRDHLGSYDYMMIALAVSCGVGAIFWIIEPLITGIVKRIRGIQSQ